MATACETKAGARGFRVDPAEHLGLVWTQAVRFMGRGLPVDDLAGEGVVGLVRACREFDPARHVLFSTYATKCVRNEIFRALRDQVPPVRVARWVADAIRKGKTADSPGLTPFGRECIAAGLAVLAPGRRRDTHPGPDALAETVPDHRAAAPELAEAVPDGGVPLGELPGREAEILRRRFGLDGGDPETLEEVGAAVGLSGERVRQLEAIALGTLRRRMGVDEPRRGRRRVVTPARPRRARTPPRPPGGACPGCGRPYGLTRRCYKSGCPAAHPGGRRPQHAGGAS
jgi:RNA polymerase primary sigma factor